jgi:hypothetical protein
VIQLEISNRNGRVQALNERWNELRSSLQCLLRERGKDMAFVPGGRSGLLCREFKGKDGKKESYRVDAGMMALLAELRAHERQAAEELGQWDTKSEPNHISTSEMIEILNAGRRRSREAWEERQALAARAQTGG